MLSEGSTNAEAMELLIAHSRSRHPEEVDEPTYERWRAESRRHDDEENAEDKRTKP
jgi:hypothetical protein